VWCWCLFVLLTLGVHLCSNPSGAHVRKGGQVAGASCCDTVDDCYTRSHKMDINKRYVAFYLKALKILTWFVDGTQQIGFVGHACCEE
jgi:hypothetical protein